MGEEELGNPKAFADPRLHLRPTSFILEGQANHQLGLPDSFHPGALSGESKILGQPAHEPRAILALQRQFVGLYYDVGLHTDILHNERPERREQKSVRQKLS